MKPFDLEAALRGEPVITRDGRHVSQIAKFDVSNNYVVYAVIDGVMNTFTETGKAFFSGNTRSDLFMHTKTKKIYVNIWDSPSCHYTRYDTLEAARRDLTGLSPDSKSKRTHKKLNEEPIELTVEV